MNLSCKACGATIAAADMNLDRLVAKCRSCNAVFGFAQHFAEPAPPEAQARHPFRAGPVRRRPRVPVPESLRIDDGGSELRLVRRWFNPAKHFFLLFFCIAWDGFLVFWYGQATQMPLDGGGLLFVLFPIAHVAVGVGMTYSVLAGFLNRTTISVGSELVVEHGPLPWRGNRRIAASDVTQCYCEETEHRGKNGVSYSYKVSAVLRSGVKVELVSGLSERDQALYIEQAIEERLRIVDVAVGGELAA